jgi:hypothetical protein
MWHMDMEFQREARYHGDRALDATAAQRQIMHEAHPFQPRGIRKCRAELDPQAWHRPAILHLHVHDGLAFHIPINEALAKGNAMDIGFLLGHIKDLG